MATWDPVEGGHEVLAFGTDRPPRRPRTGKMSAAAAGVTLGFLAGAATSALFPRGTEPPPAASAPAAPAVAAWLATVDTTWDRTTAARPSDLPGLWLVEDGRTGFPAGAMLLLLADDGTFALDPSGGVLSEQPWMQGRYALHDDRLRLTTRSTDCQGDERLVWTVRGLQGGRMLMHVSTSVTRHLRSGVEPPLCEVRSDTWVLRRLTRSTSGGGT